VAADVRDGRVLRKGWTETSLLSVEEFLTRLEGLPLAGVLCTDVEREGRMEGIDVETMGTLARRAARPLWISGGIRSMAELRALEQAGAAGAVLGMALYRGVLDPDEVAARYGGGDTAPEAEDAR